MSPDELRLELWLAILKEHGDNLRQVLVQLVQCLALGMGASERPAQVLTESRLPARILARGRVVST